MKCETIRKITIAEEERKVIKELIDFINSFPANMDEDEVPGLIVDIMTGLAYGDDLIYTSNYGEIFVEDIKGKKGE